MIKDDLTFSELAAELPAGAVTFDAATSDVLISVKAITGDTYTALTNAGVTEAFYKLRLGAGEAQVTVNAALAPGDTPLAAFPGFSYGLPTPTGEVPITQITAVRIPLNIGTVKGVTA